MKYENVSKVENATDSERVDRKEVCYNCYEFYFILQNKITKKNG